MIVAASTTQRAARPPAKTTIHMLRVQHTQLIISCPKDALPKADTQHIAIHSKLLHAVRVSLFVAPYQIRLGHAGVIDRRYETLLGEHVSMKITM